jgi:hypothetical protein
MSVERDLLGRWHNGDLLPEEYMKLMKETKELLAQPEQEHKTCSLSFLKGYARGFDVAREDYKQKVINAFGVDDE